MSVSRLRSPGAGFTAVLCATTLGSGVFASASGALAQIRLEWHAPPECPAQADVARRMTEASPEHALVAPVLATVVSAEGGYRLDLELRMNDETRARTLSDTSCGALVDALVAIVALTAGEERAVLEQARQTAAPSPPTPPRPPLHEIEVAPRLALGGGVLFGPIPTTPTVGAAAALDIDWLELGLSARWAFESGAPDSATPSAHARFELASGRASVGARAHLSRLSVIGTLWFEAGAIRAQSFGTVSPADEALLWLATGVTAELRLRIAGPIELWLGTSLGIPLNRKRFLIDEQIVFAEEHVAFEAEGGLAITFTAGDNFPRISDSSDTHR